MKKSIAIFIISIAFLFAADVGDDLTPFSSLSDNGELWSSDTINSDYLVVYFYPAAMTFGCTKQACSYRDYKSEFAESGAEIIGISGDEVEALQVFKKAHNLNFTLLSDADGKIARHFGVPVSDGGEITKKVNNEKVILKRGVTTKRWTFILDKKGTIIYKDDGVNPLSDAKNVLKELKENR